MEIVLNRLRGTGEIFRISSVKITGNILYALYMLVLVTVLLDWKYGLGAMVLYMLGESSGWGKWVGCLVSSEPKIKYDDYEGRGFPFIHYIANWFVKEKEDYIGYCNVALALRGIQWWVPVYALIGYAIDEMVWSIYIGAVVGVMFPVAAYLGRVTGFTFKYSKFECTGNWERQEVWYGLFQMLGMLSLLIIV